MSPFSFPLSYLFILRLDLLVELAEALLFGGSPFLVYRRNFTWSFCNYKKPAIITATLLESGVQTRGTGKMWSKEISYYEQ